MDSFWKQTWANQPNIEILALKQRKRAVQASAPLIWAGTLTTQHTLGSSFSTKVFVGGVPWDIKEIDMVQAFGRFGPIKVERPVGGKLQEAQSMAPNAAKGGKTGGYLYLVLENDKAVVNLLGSCAFEIDENYTPNFFSKVSSDKMSTKQVQIIPWQVNNARWIAPGYIPEFDVDAPHRAIFVGSLHGQVTAEGLARVMGQLFGEVASVDLDTDRYKYPIGSGRVVFKDFTSYLVAIQSGIVKLVTRTFSKTLQIDPFLHDTGCSVCQVKPGRLFCRDMVCLKYYCSDCWVWEHSMVPMFNMHKPMMRATRANGFTAKNKQEGQEPKQHWCFGV